MKTKTRGQQSRNIESTQAHKVYAPAIMPSRAERKAEASKWAGNILIHEEIRSIQEWSKKADVSHLCLLNLLRCV